MIGANAHQWAQRFGLATAPLFEDEAAQSVASGVLPDQPRMPVQWRPMLRGVVPVPSTPLH